MPDSDIEALYDSHTVAIVGLSDDPEKKSYEVGEYLQAAGYRVVAVNPRVESWKGETAYPSLAAVPFEIDVVDVFRNSEALPGIVDEAIARGVKGVWAQEGVSNEEAERRALAAGLLFVMDRCMMATHKLRAEYLARGLPPPWADPAPDA